MSRSDKNYDKWIHIIVIILNKIRTINNLTHN